MAWKRAAGVMLASGVLAAGCAQSHTPKASAPITPPADEQMMAGLEQSYRQAHPDALIGHVNAVLPDRHVVSVAGLPLDQVHRGDVVTILVGGQATGGVTARVYDKADGYVQMDYGQVLGGQPDPRIGDLAVRFPGGTMVEPPPGAGGPAVSVSPTSQPAPAPETTTPPPPAPVTAPAPSGTEAPAPATSPAPGAAGNTPSPAPSTTETPSAPAPTPPPAPEKKVPSDLNK